MGALTSLEVGSQGIADRRSYSGIGGEGRPAVDGDSLVIPEGSPSGRMTGLRRRAVRRLVVGGAAAAVSLILVFAVVGPAVRASRRQQCRERIGRIGGALYEHQRVRGYLPAPALADREGRPLLSWRVAILPQLGYESLHARFHLDEPWDSPHNLSLLPEMPREFACPGGPGPRAGRTGYLVAVGPKAGAGSVHTPFEPARGADYSEFDDGTSNTVLVIETDTLVPWTKPEDLRWAPDGPLPRLASPHDGGSHVVFADGMTRFLKSSIAAATLRALLTRNGGEVLGGG